MCYGWLCCMSLAQFTWLINLVKLYRRLFCWGCRCCCCCRRCFYSPLSFFHTQHTRTHTFVSTVLRGSFAQKLHTHDLYKLNAAILLNAYACFRFYFLYVPLIAFFSTIYYYYFLHFFPTL